MHAYIYTLVIPALLLMVMDYILKRDDLNWFKVLKRYIVYTFFVTLFSMVFMLVVCEQGVSFVEKVDRDAFFALKYLFLELIAALLVGGVEYANHTKMAFLEIRGIPFGKSAASYEKLKKLCSIGFYMLATLVIVLNLLLIFDNVVWGDEAYSTNLVRNNLEGIMQVLYYDENHPPLYYFWLKLFVDLFGNTILVCHAASYVLFVFGIIFALVVLQKRFGKTATGLFVIISGLASTCVEYNVEIRMYALVFMATVFCAYSAYRVLQDGKLAWFTMVLWGLVAAYSHYYGLLTVVFLMTYACLVAIYRYGKKYWIKTIVAGTAFIVGYLPWLTFLAKTLNKVTNHWWKDSAPLFSDSLDVMFAGHDMRKILLPLLALMILVIFLYETRIIVVKRENTKLVIVFRGICIKDFSAESCFLLIGILTMCTVVGIAYAVCVLVRPLLSVRYLYPLTAIMLIMLVVATCRVGAIVKEIASEQKVNWLWYAYELICFVIIMLLLLTGLRNYKTFKDESKRQDAQTAATMQLMQDMTEETALVNFGVKHIGWTVLNYYYPENSIYNCGFRDVMAEDMWFFTIYDISEEDIQWLSEQGYQVAGFGEQGISKYTFNLYHFYK